MKKLLIITLFISFFAFVGNVKAIYDPTIVPNNHFGVHITDTSDLKNVSKLVGDWGYVTFVIQKGERDPKRWQAIFDEMRKLHLIPIVRIATAPSGNIWEKPSKDEIDGWVSFLRTLNWVIKNRYVTIGNEPNHASEWGGELDPKGYADYLKVFSQKLKNSNGDFFIMPAGFDASATNTKGTQEESLYLAKMIESDNHVFDYIDGWASHSYPTDFTGSGNGNGKGTVRTFEWELNYLKYLGINKNFPVFITETGWTHSIDSLTTNIGPKIETAFKNVWNDKRIVAVTPFIYKYIAPPFDNFSWVNKDGEFYDFYYNILNLQKTAGSPIQEYEAEVITGIFPKIATVDSDYNGILFIKNTGQSIWTKDNVTIGNLQINSIFPENVEPNQIGIFSVKGKYPNLRGNYDNSVEIVHNREIFNNQFKFTTNLISRFPNFNDILNYIRIRLLGL
jgi:hypothetical protein